MSTTVPDTTAIDSVATVGGQIAITTVTEPGTVITASEKAIIEETIGDILDILENSRISNHEKIGDLILKKIFDMDFDTALEINNPNSTHPKALLFRHLENAIDNRSGENKLPKKTWLYNAVNLALDKKRIEDIGGSHLYKSLSVSLKIELLKIESTQQKIDFIDRIAKEKLSVRATRIALSSSAQLKEPGLISYIKDPTQIVDVGKIQLVGGKKKETAIKLAKDSVKSLTDEIARKTTGLKNLKALLANLEAFEPKKGRRKK